MNAKTKLQRAEQKQHEDKFAYHLNINGLGKHFTRELLFIPGRRFRLDFGDPVHKVGVEIQGAIWVPNRGHTSGTGLTVSYEKLNLGILNGWVIFQFSPEQVKKLEAIDMLRRYYIQRLKIDLPKVGVV